MKREEDQAGELYRIKSDPKAIAEQDIVSRKLLNIPLRKLDLTSIFNKRKRENDHKDEEEDDEEIIIIPKREVSKSNYINIEKGYVESNIQDDNITVNNTNNIKNNKLEEEIEDEEIEQIFIPKRKVKKIKKENSSLSKESINIIEEFKGPIKNNRIKETYYEIFETEEDEKRYKINLYFMTKFGCYLYLDPKNVLEITNYLITQYSNFSLDESFWFYDLIKGILNNQIDIRIMADHGLANSFDQKLTYLLLLKIFGSDRHQIPVVYFFSKSNKEIKFFTYYIMNPDNKCFLNSNTAGLRGEIELSFFKYNQILDYFFEPSFIIISLFDQYLNYLSETTLANSDMDYIHYFNNAKKSIEILDDIEYNKLKCLNSFNSNYKIKLQILKNDLTELSNILNSSICFKDIRTGVRKLWSKKATFCHSEQLNRSYQILKDIKL